MDKANSVLAICRRRWQMEARLCRDWVQQHYPDVFAKFTKIATKHATNGTAKSQSQSQSKSTVKERQQ